MIRTLLLSCFWFVAGATAMLAYVERQDRLYRRHELEWMVPT